MGNSEWVTASSERHTTEANAMAGGSDTLGGYRHRLRVRLGNSASPPLSKRREPMARAACLA